MSERRVNGAITAQTLSKTAQLDGPILAVVIAGVTGWMSLNFTVDALAGDSKEHRKNIEKNQQAITIIKLEAAVRAERDRAMADILKEIKEGIKELKTRRE